MVGQKQPGLCGDHAGLVIAVTIRVLWTNDLQASSLQDRLKTKRCRSTSAVMCLCDMRLPVGAPPL